MNTSPLVPCVGPRRFQWNLGGWFGAALGSSAWMLIASSFLAYHEQLAIALVPLLGFLIVMSVAIGIWRCRSRVYPFTALMTLLGFLAIVLPLVWATVSLSASDEALSAMNWPRGILSSLVVAAASPIMMLWFWFLEMSTGRAEETMHTNDSHGPAS